ncbi:hypothetical protein PR202_ga12556 [Eleusine coracana subsp. coracana]|uniref:Uncharacterized protein n=1 Tax=Eleusine coracana subsp. coracana TaxID=191504 RepID=A0AAV5CBX9_ELECO|nr:hypothetical protein PR202_ga12556 [Eleusine coracana subsp. coracana]
MLAHRHRPPRPLSSPPMPRRLMPSLAAALPRRLPLPSEESTSEDCPELDFHSPPSSTVDWSSSMRLRLQPQPSMKAHPLFVAAKEPKPSALA